MQFRRSGQRDERRRRVLIDESTGDSGQSANSQPSRGDHPGYTAAARLENQPRLTDLIPLRMRTWFLLVLLATFVICGLQECSSQLSAGGVDVFDRFALEGPGTLAAWFSSSLLLVAAAGCVMVYLLRRHKINDYRGHYRLWLWVALWCLVASLEIATEIHRSLLAVMTALPVDFSAEEFRWGWLIAVTVGGLVLGTRMSIEVRDSYWTNCFWLPTVAAYLAVMLLAFDVAWIQALMFEPLTSGLLLVIGHTALAGTVWMEARHVFRDAQGMNPAKKLKSTHVPLTVNELPESTLTEKRPTVEAPTDGEYMLADETVEFVNDDSWVEADDGLEDDSQAKRIRNKQQRAERKRARRLRRKQRRQAA